MEIEMTHTGLEFVSHAAYARAAARGEDFHLDAVAFFELLLDLSLQLGAGGQRDSHLALFFRRIDQLVPFRRAGAFTRLAVNGGCECQRANKRDRQYNSEGCALR